MITRLCAFDFDSTLIDSPQKESGKIQWSEKMGKPHQYSGWWGRPESLDLNVFDIKPFPKILNLLNKDVSTSATYTIVLTSRQEKLRPLVQKVLDVNNIHVDKLDMQRDQRTKGQKILDYTKKFPDLREINVYDDKDSDIISYEGIRSSLPEGIKFNIYLANKGNLTLVETKSKLISIIKEEIENLTQSININDIKLNGEFILVDTNNPNEIINIHKSGKIPLDKLRVETMINKLKTGIELPPVVLDNNNLLKDGYHRYYAYKIAGRKTIPFQKN